MALSDIFREVEEDVRRDRLEKFWKDNGAFVVALIASALLAVAGYQVWQRYEAGQREKDAAAYTAAQRLTDPKAAIQAFANLAKTGGGGYPVLARMEEANLLLQSGKQADAVAIYKDIAQSETGPIGAVARLRAGWALADTASRAQLQTLLQPLLDPGSAWKQTADEILAYNDYRSGKLLAASSEFARLAGDTSAPDALRARARAFAAFLAGGGASNTGTVPPPAPAPAPGVPPADAGPATGAATPAGAATP
jgi:hypothetical protein